MPASAKNTLVFSDDLTIKAISLERERILSMVTGGGQLVVAIGTDADVDLTFVQLIVAADRTARAAGGSLALAEPATGKLLETLRRGGFVETPDQCAFWLKDSEV
jgi:hypothetical protein